MLLFPWMMTSDGDCRHISHEIPRLTGHSGRFRTFGRGLYIRKGRSGRLVAEDSWRRTARIDGDGPAERADLRSVDLRSVAGRAFRPRPPASVRTRRSQEAALRQRAGRPRSQEAAFRQPEPASAWRGGSRESPIFGAGRAG